MNSTCPENDFSSSSDVDFLVPGIMGKRKLSQSCDNINIDEQVHDAVSYYTKMWAKMDQEYHSAQELLNGDINHEDPIQ